LDYETFSCDKFFFKNPKKERAMILRELAGKKGRKLFLRHIGNEFKK